MRAPAAELRRVRLGSNGELALGAGPGRGAWLCAGGACLDAAVERRAFGRALRADVNRDAVARLQGSWPSPRPGPGPGAGDGK